MKMLLGLAIGLIAFAAPATAQTASEFWSRQGDRILIPSAAISVAATAATLRFASGDEFSHKGERIDGGIKYESADKKVFATVYVYLPALAHAPTASLSADKAIRLSSKDHPVTQLGTRSQAAGGVAAAVVRAEYRNYLGVLASDAAFVKAGRWLVKLRVSGPDARKAEVDAAMDALIASLAFSGEDQPTPSMPINPAPCTRPTNATASLVTPTELQTGMDTILAADDAVASGRLGTNWCRTDLPLDDRTVPLLRNTDAPAAGRAATAALALYADNGSCLEIVRTPDGRYLLLHHQIGSTTAYGSFDRSPGDDQIAKILGGTGESGKARLEAKVRPGGSKAAKAD